MNCEVICGNRFILSQILKSPREYVLVCFSVTILGRFRREMVYRALLGPFGPFSAPKSPYCVFYIDIITFVTFLYHFHLLNVIW